MSENIDKPNWIQKITENSIVKFTFYAVAVVALVVGLVQLSLQVSAKHERELVYMKIPYYVTLVSAGYTPGLECSYGNEALGYVDVTALIIGIWNRGDESIKTENILEDVCISSEPNVRILEATVIKRTRALTQFEVINSKEDLEKGQIPITWRILEKNDGAWVQIIYIGQEGVDFFLKGQIEGVGSVKQILFPLSVKTPAEQIKEANEQQRDTYIALITMSAIGFVFFAVQALKTKLLQSMPTWRRATSAFVPIALFAMFIYFLVALLTANPMIPASMRF